VRERATILLGETPRDHELAAEFVHQLHVEGYTTRTAPRVVRVMDRLIVAAADYGWKLQQEGRG